MRIWPSRTRILVVAIWAGLAGCLSAQAQAIVDRDLYIGRVPTLGQTIRFCIATTSPLRDFDRAIADAIGGALLLRSETFDLDLSFIQNAGDRERVLFINLMDNCDAVMGANLAWTPLPDWLTVSRAYYDAPYMLVVRAGTYRSLDEIPFGSAVGAVLFSVVDEQFATYLSVLPRERRWHRLPYDDIPTMLSDVRAGIVEGGLLSGPLAGPESDPALDGLDLVSTAPLRAEPMRLGALLLRQNAFLRTALDDAIAALQADGTIDRILAELDLPPQVGSE